MEVLVVKINKKSRASRKSTSFLPFVQPQLAQGLRGRLRFRGRLPQRRLLLLLL